MRCSNRWVVVVGVLVTATMFAQAPPSDGSKVPLSAEAIGELRAKAEAGDAGAQLALGQAYEDGNGLARNDDAAARWYRKAAEQGNPAAQNNLGIMYRLGHGVDQDKAEAIRWYQKAAKQGYASAYFNLGAAYYNGDGVRSDVERACAWFTLAESAGNDAGRGALQRLRTEMSNEAMADCHAAAGELLADGKELTPNPPEAVRWYRKAAEADNPAAEWKLGEFYWKGFGVEANQVLAAQWRQKALKHGTPELMTEYGNMLRTGTDVAQDLRGAFQWYGRAAVIGYPPAMLNLGIMYAEGMGVPQSNTNAYVWVAGAALRGHTGVDAPARRVLGTLEGKMSAEELKKARKEAKKRWPGIEFGEAAKK